MHPLRELPHESAGHTPEQVSLLLAENVVFHSPLLIRPLEGRTALTRVIVRSACSRDGGKYVREYKLDDHTTFLHWKGTIDGHEFEGLELLGRRAHRPTN
jgi:hypothetical protein